MTSINRRRPTHLIAALGALALAITASTASAHVYLQSPSEGDVVEAGTDLLVEWSINIHHGPPDTYDLMFSPNGGQGFVLLVEGAPASETSYQWSVPSRSIADAELVIVQHGANDYRFMHVVSFSIEAQTPGDGGSADAGGDMGADLDASADLFDLGAEMISLPDAQRSVDAAGEQPPETAEEVLALFERRCAVEGCHTGPAPPAGLDLNISSFPDNLVNARTTVETGFRRVVPCDVDSSHLIARVRGIGVARMPPLPEEPLSELVIHQIEHWIDDGAPASGPLTEEGLGCEMDDSGCATVGAEGSVGSGAWAIVWAVCVLVAVGGRRRGSATGAD